MLLAHIFRHKFELHIITDMVVTVLCNCVYFLLQKFKSLVDIFESKLFFSSNHKENKDAAATTVSMAVTVLLDPMENPMPLVLSQNHVVTEVHEVPLEIPDKIIQEQNKTELRDHLLNLKKIPWVILERMKEEIHPEVQCKLPKVPEVVEETNV